MRYEVTAEEIQSYAEARSQDEELSESELNQVAGGIEHGNKWAFEKRLRLKLRPGVSDYSDYHDDILWRSQSR